jgi:transposase
VWVRRARDEGETAARHQGQPRGSKLDDQADFLLDLVAVTPLITLREMQQRLYAERGLSAGIGTLWRFFAARAITFKKNCARRRAGPDGHRRSSRSLVRPAA